MFSSPELREEFCMVKKLKPKPVEVLKEVEIIEHVDQVTNVPRYVYVDGPKTIIRPKYIKVRNKLISYINTYHV